MKPENDKPKQNNFLRYSSATLIAMLGGILVLDSQFMLLNGQAADAVRFAAISGGLFIMSEISATKRTSEELTLNYISKRILFYTIAYLGGVFVGNILEPRIK